MDSFLLENAPARGYFLAYYPDALVFEPYEVKDGMLWFAGCEAYRGQTPRECHLFDESKECRIVFRSHPRGPVRLVLTREQERQMDPDLLFEEEVLVKPEYASDGRRPGTLTIMNRYRYSEYDTLTLENYRLAVKTIRNPK